MSKTEKNILYWSNGQKKEEGFYFEGKEDGKYEGLNTAWHENGQKNEEATYKEGKCGPVTLWLENGLMIMKDGKIEW